MNPALVHGPYWRLNDRRGEELMDLTTGGSELELLGVMVGEWRTDGMHPLLDGDAITGRVSVEWLEGERFLIWRTHYDHPQMPDALSVLGVTEGELKMHYFDSRGVHRLYSVSVRPGGWQFSLDEPGFAQRMTGIVGDDGNTVTSRGQLCRDGVTWENDLQLTYRRLG